MNTKQVIKSQFRATLAMLQQAVEKCPDTVWNDPADKNKFWHIAYHALFYTHLYLQPTEADFTPWSKQQKDYQFMGPVPWPPHNEPEIGDPYTKADVLEYITFCEQQVDDVVDTLDLAGPSGFDWLPFDKLELQFYSIRHLQLHTGELCERLWDKAQIEVSWVGMKG